MNVSLYQAAAAMNAHARWQDMIAQNLAAGTAPGFRKQEISFDAIQAGINPSTAPGAPSYVIPAANVSTSYEAGETRATGNLTDLALDGPGFLEVQLPNGTRAYTRDGELHISAQGELVTKQGYPVLGTGGPIQIDPNSGGTLTISSTGDVSQGDQSRGKLHIVEFTQPRALTPIGNGCFIPQQAGAVPKNATVTTVSQGFLEGSNSSTSLEMSNLIMAMRMFEANQKVLQTQDDRMGKVIAELGGS
ncbi:MAG: flagellar hook-basal body protein [Verrucomicrobiota bacterium]